MKANKEQQEIINTINGQIVVIACPGSGKTTTSLSRIHHMIAACGIEPSKILMVTFSSAAAKEMAERYRRKFGNDSVTFSTIHSMCLRILEKYAGYNKSCILSDSESYFYEQLREHPEINDREEFVNGLITEISVVKNNRPNMAKYQPKCCKSKALFMNLYKHYEAYKENLGLIDFDDMLLKAYDIMKNDKKCLKELREQYQYIQVDEYQDTNFLQRDILYLLAGENGNLAVVGDDDQSIYGFRGAQPSIMLNFKKDYPSAKEIYLSTNYRSCRGIVSIADRLIQNNKMRFKKDFIAFKKEKGQIEYIEGETKEEQLYKVYNKIQTLLNNGVDPNTIAVLYRTNKEAEAMANYFLGHNIPFYSNEKIPNKYEHWLFYDIKAYYNLANHKVKEKVDIARVINHPNRYLNHYRYILSGLDQSKMRKVAYETCQKQWLRNNALDQITNFLYLLSQLKDIPPTDFLRKLYGVGGYKKYLKDYAEFRNVPIDELENIWMEYVKDAEKYNDWKAWSIYILHYKAALKEALKERNGIALSSMHGSKGLEWDYVFMINCVEGNCPFKKDDETPVDMEEERRLFYVAITRAKQYLYLCSYKTKGKEVIKPSPFLIKEAL